MYCWGFFALGIFTSAPGPILPTLMQQVNVSLAAISFIFSARAVGFVVGSVISGYVMDSYQKHLISDANGTKFLLRRKQRIADYLWSLPRWSWWPMSAHNVWTISLLIAAVTNAAVPYVTNVYVLGLLVIINGACFGNINTFGNVLLLTLFDTEIAADLDLDAIYDGDANASISLDVSGPVSVQLVGVNGIGGQRDSVQSEQQRLIGQSRDHEQSLSSLYGATPSERAAQMNAADSQKDERVGPFMQALQAIYALGGLLAPIAIQFSFELTDSYAGSFWLFSALYIPPALVLLMYPEPIRMSVVSDRLKEIERTRKAQNTSHAPLLESTLHNQNNATAGASAAQTTAKGAYKEVDGDVLEELQKANKKFWSRCLCAGFALFLLWYVGAQVGYGMYITTYAIDYLGASDAMGRYLASANWAGLFVGRFVAVPLSQSVSALNMVWLDLAGVALGTLLLFFTLMNECVVWVSAVMVGLCMASVWPCMFVWAEGLMPVTGIFASIMVGGGSLGEFVVPAAQGNVMAAYGSEWFNQVMFVLSVLLIANLVVNVVIAKRLAHFL